MPKLRDLKLKPPKVLLYGRAGSGKTALALTLGSALQLIDLDQGLVTGLTLKDKFSEARLDVDVLEFADEDLKKPRAFERTKNYVQDVQTACGRGKYDFKVLALDSLTSLASDAMDYVLRKAGKLGQQPQINHWGECFREVETLLKMLKTLPIAVIVIAHEQMGEVDGVERVEIAISGKKFPPKIPTLFDEVLYMRIRPAGKGESKYSVLSRSTPAILTRSRHNVPPEWDVDGGMWELLALMGYRHDGGSPQERQPKVLEPLGSVGISCP